ncbi:MAG: porin, partial [Bacteroidota bacterium]
GSNSTGVKWSPLVAARLALAIGDPEKAGYSLGYETNFYSQRKGIVMGVGATYQGETDQFSQSQMLSVDLMANYGIFNFDAEWNYMERENESAIFPAHTWHIRSSLNILLKNKTILEPNFMYSFFSGASGAETVGFFDGRDLMWNVGINWYLKKKSLKLSLHYTDQDGFGNRNQYTFQNGRSVLKGDYWGLGLQVFI